MTASRLWTAEELRDAVGGSLLPSCSPSGVSIDSRTVGRGELFVALRDVMLVMVQWIIWIAPVGVFALAFMVGARAGTTAFGALVHYIVVVSAVGVVMGLLAYPLAAIGGDSYRN